MIGELLALALTNLGRARARLLMTAGGVVVGTTAVILLIAMTLGLQKAAEAGIGNSEMLTRIDVFPNWEPSGDGNLPQLTPDLVRSLWQIPGVRLVIPVSRLQGGELVAGKYTGWAEIIGVDPRLLPYPGLQVEQGTLTLEPGQVIAGGRIRQNFYDMSNPDTYEPVEVDMVNTPIKLRLNSWGGESRSVTLNFSAYLLLTEGIYDYVMLMPADDVRDYNEWITGQAFDPETFVYDQITVIAASRETVQPVMDIIREMGYQAGGMGDYLNALNSFFTTMRLMLGGIGGVALLVAAFGVANTMMMAIMERTREIGIMKAVGATQREILTLFLLEAGLVGGIGGLAGGLLSLVLQNAINSGLRNLPQEPGGVPFLPFDPSQMGGELIVIPPELLLFAVLLATGVGIAAGVYPAWRAANLLPVMALKHD